MGKLTDRPQSGHAKPPRPALEILERRVLFAAGTSITEFHLPSDPAHFHYAPARMAAGPDGNLWFGGFGPPFTIDRVTTSGAITEFAVPEIRTGLSENTNGAITAGPDGNVWFSNGGAIGRVTPGGSVTWFPLPRYPENAAIEGMTTGPDGNLWFTEYFNDRIGRLSPSGGFSEFGIPTAGSRAMNITAGPDGALWFTERAANKIGRITTAGAITEFPSVAIAPDGITKGPDGNLWFASQHAVGKMTTAGQVTLFPIDSSETTAATITAGPDGALWFLPYGGGAPIGRMTTGGALTLFPTPTPNSLSGRAGITTGSDGNIWFVETAADQVGRINIQRTDPAVVRGRSIFYNQSAFDGNDIAANAADDGAIATDKQALLPGHTATFANYTSFSKGITGIMIDVDGMTPGMELTLSDFKFKVGNDGNPAGWGNAPAPRQILIRRGAGVGKSDRIEIIWTDNGGIKAPNKQWLQVTLRADATGLAKDDVFYFGNAVGDAGNHTTDAFVTAQDELLARANPHNLIDNPAPVDYAYDYNRDKKVDAVDQLIARGNHTNFTNSLQLINAPAATAAASDVLRAGSFGLVKAPVVGAERRGAGAARRASFKFNAVRAQSVVAMKGDGSV